MPNLATLHFLFRSDWVNRPGTQRLAADQDTLALSMRSARMDMAGVKLPSPLMEIESRTARMDLRAVRRPMKIQDLP